jgi:DNA invertase Pin-like site-specific DNA recombinase
MTKAEQSQCFAYYRTSSASNVGRDKDSEARQRAACQKHAQSQGLTIAAEYYDAAISGADPLDARPGFAAMLETIAGNGVRVILVETASRFARDLMVQEIGFRRLKDMGIALIACDAPQSFVDDTPTATLIRQILGAVAEFDKAMLVAKLAAARKRAKAQGRKVEGRPSTFELAPEAVNLARKYQAEGLALRAIAARLSEAGHLASSGKPYAASAVMRMLKQGPTSKSRP